MKKELDTVNFYPNDFLESNFQNNAIDIVKQIEKISKEYPEKLPLSMALKKRLMKNSMQKPIN